MTSGLIGPATPATTTSADFSLRHSRRPFRHKARSPQVRVALLHRTTAASTPPRLGHESFVVFGPLALLGNAFYAVLVHRLAIYAPRFLPTFGRPHAVALDFARCDQLAAGLAPTGVRPCWAHRKKAPTENSWGFNSGGGWLTMCRLVSRACEHWRGLLRCPPSLVRSVSANPRTRNAARRLCESLRC